MDRGAWQATAYGIAKSQTEQLILGLVYAIFLALSLIQVLVSLIFEGELFSQFQIVFLHLCSESTLLNTKCGSSEGGLIFFLILDVRYLNFMLLDAGIFAFLLKIVNFVL